MGKEINCEEVATYREPNKVRAKGCGKRIKGGKEKAVGNSVKGRLCKGCAKKNENKKVAVNEFLPPSTANEAIQYSIKAVIYTLVPQWSYEMGNNL
ncbi:hypothetical protein FRX31_034520 [Thalictrum thalictroides]|uniref:Uncharacterized protein n=1 Tax=Thalictrum thalictroides TaxID=46969 RepID=A0A7J6UTG6_THATH|nr:hypothetical protein FRX31_034520 [Thalictrum thalictroides]